MPDNNSIWLLEEEKISNVFKPVVEVKDMDDDELYNELVWAQEEDDKDKTWGVYIADRVKTIKRKMT